MVMMMVVVIVMTLMVVTLCSMLVRMVMVMVMQSSNVCCASLWYGKACVVELYLVSAAQQLVRAVHHHVWTHQIVLWKFFSRHLFAFFSAMLASHLHSNAHFEVFLYTTLLTHALAKM